MHQVGDRHTWRFRVGDAVRGSLDSATTASGSAAAVVLVYLRATFDVDISLLEGDEPLAEVRWSHAHAGSGTPARKKARGAVAPWGEQTALTRLCNGCTESVFMLALARDALEGDVHCTVQWNAAPPSNGRPLAGLRYAIYSHLASEAPAPYTTTTHYYYPSTTVLPSSSATLGAHHQPPQPGRRLAVIVGVSKYTRRRGGGRAGAATAAARGRSRMVRRFL